MSVMILQSAPDAVPSIPSAVLAASSLRIPSPRVRTICGGISDMTLHRWLNNPAMNFPRPIYIGKRRYWKEADILAWLEAQEVAV